MPDFRNLGVIARVLVAVNAAALVAALYAAPSVRAALERFIEDAAFIEPLLFVEVTVLFALSRQLGRLPYFGGCIAVIVLCAALAAGYLATLQQSIGTILRGAFFAALLASVLLGYLRLYVKAFSPALAEARLQALQSRIRPHFLFNSINAVLALIRRDPKRAERTLEDLADLFRSLVSDATRFVRLSDEIALLERYAEIEQLRLGERLRITWELDAAPSDALLPPLVLQPLLENAVYHGVEPATEPGEVLVRIERRGDRVLARIENPLIEAAAERAGNRMAMDNIRERLALFFDAEARMDVRIDGGRYSVQIQIPYLTSARAVA
ncbi:MAG TPA: histidine kinase [Burkholderiales bacterium]|nr:histidine kinase [Burkholderiales bacterium]